MTDTARWLGHESIAATNQDSREGVCLLSIDGGGIRGLAILLILERIMREVGNIEEAKDPAHRPDSVHPADYFDLAGGTSTGGLVCIMLFRLRMDISTAMQEYRRISPEIFHQPRIRVPGWNFCKAAFGRPWFKGKSVESAVKDIVGQHLPACEREARNGNISDAPMVSPSMGGETETCKAFVCAVRKSDGSAIKFRTYAVPDDCKNGFESCKIWEAARATSAAPFYFPAVTVNQVKFWDGGLANNNPAHEVKLEKYMLFPSDRYRVSCFVSIGTGWADTKPEKSVLPGIGRGRQILGFVTNVDRAHQHMAQDFTRSRPPVYFRFNPTTGNEKIGLADHHLLKSLEAHTNRYLQNPQVQSAITDCAKVLCERREKKRLKVVALEKRS